MGFASKQNTDKDFVRTSKNLSHNASWQRTRSTSADPKTRGGHRGATRGGQGPGREPGEKPHQASAPGEGEPTRRGEREKRERETGAQGRKRPPRGGGSEAPPSGERRQQNRNSKNPCHLANSQTHPSHRTHFHPPPRKTTRGKS